MEGMPVLPQEQWQEELRSWRKAFDEALIPRQDKLEDIRKAGLSIELGGQEKSGRLKERSKVLEQEWTNKALAVGKKLDQMAIRETEVAQANRDLDKLKDWIIRLSEWRDRREKFIAEDLQALEEVAELARKNKAKMQLQRAHIAWYKDLFGIRCEYSGGIKVIFTRIDPSEVDKEFSITILHDDQADKYSMLDCQPPIRAAEELLDQLNRSNKFFEFLRRVRVEFQALVLGQG